MHLGLKAGLVTRRMKNPWVRYQQMAYDPEKSPAMRMQKYLYKSYQEVADEMYNRRLDRIADDIKRALEK